MTKEEAKNTVKEILSKMGCTNLTFLDPADDELVAVFNCKEITSFVEEVPGWDYSGIQLDQSGEGHYNIMFKKSS